MIGICTRYRKADCTLAAFSIARHLDAQGRPFAFNCFDRRACCVDPAYDNRVHRQSFSKWSAHLEQAIWTSPVDTYFVEAARKRKLHTTLYTSWDQLGMYDNNAISAYTHVLVPSLLQAIQLRDKFNTKNVAVLPYDSGLPITYKQSNVSPGEIHLFISLYGAQLRRVPLSAIIMLSEIVRDMPNVHVTIACSKGLALYTKQELATFEHMYGKRWNVLHDCPWYKQAVLMGDHDLVVWPTQMDGLGIVGSTALSVGTPVIAWDAPPMNEFLSAGRNAILVSCEVTYNWLGMPVVKPNYVEFDRTLRWLLHEPSALNTLRKYTAERLTTRRQDYEKGWNVVLPADV